MPAAARPVPAAARPALAEPPLRLTARGRMVVAAVAAVLVTALLVVVSVVVGAGPAAQATNHPVSRQAAEKGLARVTVRPGESLWSVAEAADPDADTRIVVQEIIELNGLNGMVVNPGERLLVPRG
ncbi:MAG TPA: LysM peptidoglycan-binding domain-containing protein [Streptosporangiaceae bacterium]|nr:LysM peptidoglycan-binding domain-containing protein [Streptosporangiaceae bacterium]